MGADRYPLSTPSNLRHKAAHSARHLRFAGKTERARKMLTGKKLKEVIVKMTNQTTRRALLTSALAILACVAMLVGTTFAWFTDTASTAVNTITSGRLKIALGYYESDEFVSVKDQVLEFVKASAPETDNSGAEVTAEKILWEPGCTYRLPKLVIRNDGNLALKYKVIITGIKGDAKLNEAIDWTINVDDNTYSADAEQHLGVGEEHTFALEGTMRTDAGNEYQDLSITGVTIGVAATQDTVEYDSNGNDYDASAEYPEYTVPEGTVVNNSEEFNLAIANAKEGDTIVFAKSTTEPIKLTLTAPLTLKNLTFKAAPGVTVKGLWLSSTSAKTRLDLENITFEDVTFTDKVVIGQDTSSYGLSKCTNITFDNCKFDLSGSREQYPDAIKRGGASVSGTISEKEAVAYMDGLTVKNCEFANVRYAVYAGKARNTVVESCTFTNCSSYAIRIDDAAGKVAVNGNTISKAAGVLTINTVGNNYSTTDIQTDVVIKDNTATDMTCANGDVYIAAFDNARASGKSTYTITGNSVTYTQKFDEPQNGFRIKSNYSPSKAEFIPNT